MRPTPAPLLSVLTMPGPDEPWVVGDGAFRIVMHPSLGWPLAPFAVFWSSTEPDLHEPGWRLNGPGAFGNEEVDGEAWLVLGAPDADRLDPGYVVLQLSFDEAPEVAVVRSIGDLGLGVVTRTQEPYRLCAPAIAVLRIRGRCRIDAVLAAAGLIDFAHDDQGVLALPLPHAWPQYHGIADPRSAADARIRNGAPQRSGPHEAELFGDPADAEGQRVGSLVEPWVMPTLDALLARPLADRFTRSDLPDISGSPPPGRAELDDHSALLVAASDPGVARWLGLADQVRRLGGSTQLVTVAGIWALPPQHELERLAFLVNDPAPIRNHLFAVFNERVILDIEELGQSVQLLWGWTQAWIDFGALPDRPPGPLVTPSPRPRWVAGPTPEDDVAHVAVASRRTALLGALGVVPAGQGPTVHVEIAGAPGRQRPILSREGTAFVTRFGAPFAPQQYVIHQSDAFGRWSDAGTDLVVGSPARPGPPAPEPVVSVVPELPAGDQPWLPRLDVRLRLPQRVAGQPEVTEVVIAGGGGSVTVPVAAGQIDVAGEVFGPALTAGARAAVAVTVTFHASPAAASGSVRTVTVTDPRPPLPPEPPAVLRFTSRGDATGTAVASVALLPGPRIAGYHVDVAQERDLIRASGLQPPAGLRRDARARFWLDQPRSRLAPAFYRAEAAMLPVTAGAYLHHLYGELAELVAFRLVPVGTNGASADATTCPLVFYAVPLAVVPPPPLLLLDRAASPPVLVVRPRPGGATPTGYRIRLLSSPDADVRGGLIVAAGPLAGTDARAPVPVLRPFAQVVLVAEVRGDEEPGEPPLPGLWSPPSNRLQHTAIPDGPPRFVTAARRLGTAIALTIDADLAPHELSDYAALVYRRDQASGAFTIHRGPIILASDLDDGNPLPLEDLAVVVVDPLGRRSQTIPVVAPPP